jgi:hypothetical protein
MAQPSIFNIISSTSEEFIEFAYDDKTISEISSSKNWKSFFIGKMTTPDIPEIAEAVITEKDKMNIENCMIWRNKKMQIFVIAGEYKRFVVRGMHEIQKLITKCSLIYQEKIDAHTPSWIDHDYDD